MSNHTDYESAIAAFETMPVNDRDALKSFYESEVMPLSISRIRQLAAAKNWAREPVDVLFVTCGRQPYSITLSLAVSPARFIAFLHTDDSLASAEQALAALRSWGSDVPHRYLPVGVTDGVAVYRHILSVFLSRRPTSVVVDITSGTKAMTAAASSAAVVIGAAQRYIESLPTKIPGWHGREQPHELPHPLVELGDLKRREAQRLFNRGAFEHAAQLFSELHARGAPAYRFDERAKLARVYEHADALRFADAQKEFGDADLSRLQHRGDSSDPLCNEAERIRRQLARLAEIAGGQPSDETLLRYLIAYARRREAQKLYDAAALVHYRTIELCVGARLARHGIDKDAVTPAAIESVGGAPATEILAHYNDTAQSKEHHLAEWPAKLALMQGWTLLRVLSDPLTDAVDARRLMGQTSARNESIFAHGRKPISAASFASFVDLADVVRHSAARLEGWSLPQPDADFDFVRFDED